MKDHHSFTALTLWQKYNLGKNNQTWTMKHNCDLHWIECLEESFLITFSSKGTYHQTPLNKSVLCIPKLQKLYNTMAFCVCLFQNASAILTANYLCYCHVSGEICSAFLTWSKIGHPMITARPTKALFTVKYHLYYNNPVWGNFVVSALNYPTCTFNFILTNK